MSTPPDTPENAGFDAEISSESGTQKLAPNRDGFDRAVAVWRAGDLVAFPTETVYGLGADACNGEAVAKVYAAKGRPSFNPLIAHVASVQAAKRYVEWCARAQLLADAFWPGPLTLVLPVAKGHGVSDLVTAGLHTLAIRVPAHPTARALLDRFDGPVAAPSANPSGRISPTTAQHVLDGLSGRIAAVVDDGPCSVGLESTIVGLAGAPALLRPGGVSAEDIESVLGHTLVRHAEGDGVSAPGQLVSHYAPGVPVRLNAVDVKPEEVMLGFGDMPCDLNLSQSGSLIEAAANLFGHLHRLDSKAAPIAVAPIPTHGLGAAINDRLRRAAAPRDR